MSPEGQKKEEDSPNSQVNAQENDIVVLVRYLPEAAPSSLENHIPWMLEQEP